VSSEPTDGVAFLRKKAFAAFCIVPTPCRTGIILTHGAGANCNAPVLLAVTALFCDAGRKATASCWSFWRPENGACDCGHQVRPAVR